MTLISSLIAVVLCYAIATKTTKKKISNKKIVYIAVSYIAINVIANIGMVINLLITQFLGGAQ